MLRALGFGTFWFLSLGIALLSLLIVTEAVMVGMAEAAPHIAHYDGLYTVALYAHIAFGPLALLLAPLQFWRWLRTRHRAVHRAIGYAYASSIVIGGISALLILPQFKGSAFALLGFAILALLWVTTTVRAVLHARAGRYDAHRVWMLRSAALTFAAVVLRFMTFPLIASGLTLTQSYDITAWASWLLPLAAVQLRLSFPSRTRAATAGAPS